MARWYYVPAGTWVVPEDEAYLLQAKAQDAADDNDLPQIADVRFPSGGVMRTYACLIEKLEQPPTAQQMVEAQSKRLRFALHAVAEQLLSEAAEKFKEQALETIAATEAEMRAVPGITKAEILPKFTGLRCEYRTNFAWEG